MRAFHYSNWMGINWEALSASPMFHCVIFCCCLIYCKMFSLLFLNISSLKCLLLHPTCTFIKAELQSQQQRDWSLTKFWSKIREHELLLKLERKSKQKARCTQARLHIRAATRDPQLLFGTGSNYFTSAKMEPYRNFISDWP